MKILKLLSSDSLSAAIFLCKEAPLPVGVWVLLAVCVLCFLSLALSEFGNLVGIVTASSISLPELLSVSRWL